VLIENMGGAGGTIAARHVAKADPDGYTFLFAGPGHASAPFLRKQPPYDPLNDFVPVSLVTQFPLVMVVNPKVPAKNVAEFIALAKAAPGKHTFGSSGVGGSSHIPAEMFAKQAGIKLTHVPFRGNGPSSAALLGGQIDMIVDGLAPQIGNISEGRVRVIGVTTKERTPFLPDAPAVSEALPGYQFPMWVALFAPAKTPKPIVDRLAAEVAKAMQDPVTRKRYADVKVTPVGSTPGELDKFFREQVKFNEDIIKSANIQTE
jgi:tripartite-type tricarboxylate transporter receptor subunit TctC